MFKKIVLLIPVLYFTTNCYGQQNRCGTMPYKYMEEEKNPSIKENRKNTEATIRSFVAAHTHFRMNQTPVIPVVVHVLYNLAEENVSDFKIQEQIDVKSNFCFKDKTI